LNRCWFFLNAKKSTETKVVTENRNRKQRHERRRATVMCVKEWIEHNSRNNANGSSVWWILVVLCCYCCCCSLHQSKAFDLDLNYYHGFGENRDLFVMAWYFNNFIPDYALGFQDWDRFTSLENVTHNIYGRKIQKPKEFYNLMHYSTRLKQYELARGVVDAFIYYHYWDGHPVIMEPLIARLVDGQPALPFALCYVNDMLTPTEPVRHALYLLPVLTHKDYINIEGKKLFFVYQMNAMSRFQHDYFQQIIDTLETYNVTLYLVHCEQEWGDESLIDSPWPSAVAEFAPNIPGGKTYEGQLGLPPRIGKSDMPHFRGFTVSWDQTPRYPNGENWRKGTEAVFNDTFELTAFENVLNTKLRMMEKLPNEHRILIGFAWNEWGEGAVLENEDEEFNYLGVLRRVVDRYRTKPNLIESSYVQVTIAVVRLLMSVLCLAIVPFLDCSFVDCGNAGLFSSWSASSRSLHVSESKLMEIAWRDQQLSCDCIETGESRYAGQVYYYIETCRTACRRLIFMFE